MWVTCKVAVWATTKAVSMVGAMVQMMVVLMEFQSVVAKGSVKDLNLAVLLVQQRAE